MARPAAQPLGHPPGLCTFDERIVRALEVAEAAIFSIRAAFAQGPETTKTGGTTIVLDEMIP